MFFTIITLSFKFSAWRCQGKLAECKRILKEVDNGEKEAVVTSFTIDSIIIVMNRNKVSVADNQRECL